MSDKLKWELLNINTGTLAKEQAPVAVYNQYEIVQTIALAIVIAINRISKNTTAREQAAAAVYN